VRQALISEGGTSPDWSKIKARLKKEFVIGGITEGKGSRKQFGALLLGAHENGELLGKLQFSSPLRNKDSNIHSNQNKRQTDDNWTNLKHFFVGLTTRLQFSYEQTACECSKTRKILQTNGQKHPTKTIRFAQPGQGVLRTTCRRGSL
jgi:hypothetical protein